MHTRIQANRVIKRKWNRFHRILIHVLTVFLVFLCVCVFFIFIPTNRTMFGCCFFLCETEMKSIYCMFIAFWILSLYSQLEAVCLFCDISNYLLWYTGMRKGISNFFSDLLRLRRRGEKKEQKSICLILGMLCLLIFFSLSFLAQCFFKSPLRQWVQLSIH